jgi:hypothetical protein
MICCSPLDDEYETEKINVSLVRLEWAQNVVRACICFVFFLKNFELMDVALMDSQDRESQSNEGMLDDLQEHARKLLASTSTTCVYSQI